MNKQAYRHLLRTYGRQPAIWLCLAAELVRTAMQRVWVAIIVAQIATNLAGHNITAARHHAILFLIVYVAGAIIGAAGEVGSIWAEDEEYQRQIMLYYHKLTGKDMNFYRDNQTGYLVSLFRQYLDSMMMLVRLLRGDAAKMVVSLLAPVVVLFVANRLLGLVACGIIIAQAVYVGWSSSKVNRHRQRAHEIYRKLTGEVGDQITNIVAFKSGGFEKRASAKVQRLAEQETETFWQRRKIVVLLDLPRELATAAGVTLAFFVVLSGRASNTASVGLIMLTLTYMFQIVRSVGELPNLMTQHDELITKMYPTLAYLDETHEAIRDPARPKKLKVRAGAIDIDHVQFAYPDQNSKRAVPVFRDLTLHIKGGQQVGVVGLSGAGKSTLTSLLMRFDDVNEGSIAIDGIDVRQVRQSDLHWHIAYVPQEPLLFHSTIRENIAYFKDGASEDMIERAARAAHAHEFIIKLPQGYDTVVGERGVKLSGGQKQRVVIARAILKDAPIMIFDEATSALDSESERIIQSTLPKITAKHTAIVIAHRLSTVAGLDRILVMHDGQIVEDGTHDELLALRGRYYGLWQKQIAGGAAAHEAASETDPEPALSPNLL